MTTCIRKCKFWASFIWEKKRILFGFFIDVFWEEGKREREEREGGVVQGGGGELEKDGGRFLIFLYSLSTEKDAMF